VQIACGSAGQACRGTVSILVLERRSLSARRRYVPIGRARWSIPAGRRASVRVKLSRAGRAALDRRGELAARVVIRMAGTTTSKAVKLRR
jgi:hypothetical protein